MRSIIVLAILIILPLHGLGQCEDLCGHIRNYENQGKVVSFENGLLKIRFTSTKWMKVGHTGLIIQTPKSDDQELSLSYPKRPKLTVPVPVEETEDLEDNEPPTLADVRIESIENKVVTYSIIRKRYSSNALCAGSNRFETNFTVLFSNYNYTSGKKIRADLADSTGGWREGCDCEGWAKGTWRYYDKDGVLFKEVIASGDRQEGPITLFSKKGDTISIGGYEAREREGLWKEFDSDGNLVSVINYSRGSIFGDYSLYYPNGQLKTAGQFGYFNAKEGLWKSYHSNGELASVISYDGDRPDGIYEEYYENGTIKTKGSYSNELKQSGWTEYHENGEVSAEFNYRYGKLIGGKEWHPNGQEKAQFKVDYRNGDTTNYAEFYENGNLKLLCGYSDGKRDGPFEEYYEDGQIKIKREYENGNRSGDWKEYYEDGTLKRLEENGWDTMHGKYREYYPSGEVKVLAHYTEGHLSGNYLEYFENGQEKVVGYYYTGGDIMKASSKEDDFWKNYWGKRYGKWVTYHPSGKMKSSGKYKKGKKIGKWTFWNESGIKTSKKY